MNYDITAVNALCILNDVQRYALSNCDTDVSPLSGFTRGSTTSVCGLLGDLRVLQLGRDHTGETFT